MREIGTVPDMNCQALGVGDSPHFPGRPERVLAKVTDADNHAVPRGKKVTGGFNEQA